MKWTNFIDEIYLINLNKREDRLLQITEDFEQYEIPFKRVAAIESNNGAVGLRDTMVLIFNEAIEKGYQNILVFEDDAEIKVGKEQFHLSMDSIVDNLPENYIMVFLGGQITGKVLYQHSPNIIQASKVFSTHAVIYSNQGMKEILGHGISAPIDTFYVNELENLKRSYISYPLLVSQRPGKSDIGGQVIDWRPFIDQRYEQQLSQFHGWNHGR